MKARGNVAMWMAICLRFFKPLMNQRGLAGDPAQGGDTPDPNAVTLDENGFIPGTPYKSVSDLIKGHTELKGRFDAQGNELGTIRKEHEGLKTQAQTLAQVVQGNLKKEGKTDNGKAAVDYDAQIAEVEKQLDGIDPMADDFPKVQRSLVSKLTKLTALSQHEKTLSAAGELMKKELSERDVKAQTKAFHDANPTFNTPEMQARIREYLANDTTGMSDPLVAFREIERDDARLAAKTLADENAEMKKVLELAKGKESTGKVVVKGQTNGQLPSKSQKATGKDLDAGMAAILAAHRGT
jgi:hypothetical protein